MKNHNPASRQMKFASVTQRLLSGIVLLTLAVLIWLAWSGRYDHEVNRLAAWFGKQYHALVR